VRNPRFHEWSADAQPDGYPDAIEWSFVGPDDDPSVPVEDGVADVVADSIDSGRLDQLATLYPDQVHVALSTKVFLEILNTTTAPVDDVPARHAAAYATDRQAVQQAYGGPLQGRVTCQVLPPTFPGYRPSCPFSPDGRPDLDTARALVRQAGAVGTPVVVYGA